jgi:hypothetical protein
VLAFIGGDTPIDPIVLGSDVTNREIGHGHKRSGDADDGVLAIPLDHRFLVFAMEDLRFFDDNVASVHARRKSETGTRRCRVDGFL